MRRLKIRSILTAAGLGAGLIAGSLAASTASDLIFVPTNPAFGGSPLLDDYLIGTAQIQNRFVNTGGTGGASSAPPVITFPPITIDLGGVAPATADDGAATTTDSSAFVPQINSQ